MQIILSLQCLLGALACLCIVYATKTFGLSPHNFKKGTDFANLHSALRVTLPSFQATVFDNEYYDEVFVDRWQKTLSIFEQFMNATDGDEARQLWETAQHLFKGLRASILAVSKVDMAITLNDLDRISDIYRNLSQMNDEIATVLGWWHSLPKRPLLHEVCPLQLHAKESDTFKSSERHEADSIIGLLSSSPSQESATKFEAASKSYQRKDARESIPQTPSEKAASSKVSDKDNVCGFNRRACPVQPFSEKLSKYLISIGWRTFNPKDAFLPCFKLLGPPKARQSKVTSKQGESQESESQQPSLHNAPSNHSQSNKADPSSPASDFAFDCWVAKSFRTVLRLLDMLSSDVAADNEYNGLDSLEPPTADADADDVCQKMTARDNAANRKKGTDSAQKTKLAKESDAGFTKATSKYTGEHTVISVDLHFIKRVLKGKGEMICKVKGKRLL